MKQKDKGEGMEPRNEEEEDKERMNTRRSFEEWKKKGEEKRGNYLEKGTKSNGQRKDKSRGR